MLQLCERCGPGVLISYMLSVSHANKWELFFFFSPAKWPLSKVGVQVDGLTGESGETEKLSPQTAKGLSSNEMLLR